VPLVVGTRHGRSERTLTGTFGKTRIAVPRARLVGEDVRTREWKSVSLRAYQRRTKAADALMRKHCATELDTGATRANSKVADLGRLRDAEHARNVRLGNAVGGHRLGLSPLQRRRAQRYARNPCLSRLQAIAVRAHSVGAYLAD
jgi:hypothetical protein